MAVRKKRITFQRAPMIDDGYTVREDWDAPVTLGTVMAAINFGRGDERRAAAMEQSDQPATFTVTDSATTRSLLLTDRIMFDGAAWDIRSIVPAKTPGERDITATRAA